MNITVANAYSGYFEVLYNMNQRLVSLFGIDIMNDRDTGEKVILDLIQDIPRVIPYSYDKDSKLKLKKRDGMLEFADEINYIDNDYNEILKLNLLFLDKVRIIRNKYEHKMHGIDLRSSIIGGEEKFCYKFTIDEEQIDVEASEFVNLIKMINTLFDRIRNDIIKYATNENKKDYNYFNTLCKHSFEDFNVIYDSNLIDTFGRIVKDY